MLRAEFTVIGRVQGVGFRYFILEKAKDRSISGEVWNNYDGSVGIISYHIDINDFNEFLSVVKKGPILSNVLDIETVVKSSDPPENEAFIIRN